MNWKSVGKDRWTAFVNGGKLTLMIIPHKNHYEFHVIYQKMGKIRGAKLMDDFMIKEDMNIMIRKFFYLYPDPMLILYSIEMGEIEDYVLELL